MGRLGDCRGGTAIAGHGREGRFHVGFMPLPQSTESELAELQKETKMCTKKTNNKSNKATPGKEQTNAIILYTIDVIRKLFS